VVQNGFNDLVFTIDGKEKRLGLSHLENLFIEINDFQLDDGRSITVTLHMRPTNHLYSRRFEPETDDEVALKATGELLLRYEHEAGNYQAVRRVSPVISTEKRVFCARKYEQSKLFPVFVESLKTRLQTICVLANQGDTRSCLSALWVLPSPYSQDDYYIVIFKLTKLNGQEVNMLIETAFVVGANDSRVKRLRDKNYRQQQKPFLVILKNVLAGRRPFDSPRKPKKTKRPK
jgi:hypothetical protein